MNQRSSPRRHRWQKALLVVPLAFAGVLVPALVSSAYQSTQQTMYLTPASQECMKGRGNCVIYPKTAQLPSGRIVVTWEQAYPSAATYSAYGETLPLWVSDDNGDTWTHTLDIEAPAFLSDDPEVAEFTSNWTNPIFYVMPETVGDLEEGTLILGSVVTGEDYYWVQRKAANPSWTASNDGDRYPMGIALFASTDNAESFEFVNMIAVTGWQGGAAGAAGQNVADVNPYRQNDPLWEPFFMVYDGKLVCYYSDENEYKGFDPVTGIPELRADNDTYVGTNGRDPNRQILVHKTWDGVSAAWSEPVVDTAGDTAVVAGEDMIGGGRPGMTTVVPTTDGKWLLTFEFWVTGQTNTRYLLADNPLEFFKESPRGLGINTLPNYGGTLAVGGSPVTIAMPDGRLVYNASGSGDIWVNYSGRSDGVWTRLQTPVSSSYSRPIQPIADTGQLLFIRTSNSNIYFGHVDIGYSNADYFKLYNRASGLVLGTGGNISEATYAGAADVRVEADGAATNPATQLWQVIDKPGGAKTLLNKSGGRSAAVYNNQSAIAGRLIGSRVDNIAGGTWNFVPTDGGYYLLQHAAAPTLYLTAGAVGTQVSLQPLANDGSQEWMFSTSLAGDINVELEIPEYLGGLGLEFSSNSMSLGSMGLSTDKAFWEGIGALPAITIEDMRAADPSLGWDATITAGDWVIGPGNVDGKAFGIAPEVISAAYGQNVIPGAGVEAWFEGFKTPGTELASAAVGFSRGVAEVGGDVAFRAPSTVPAGAYSGVFSVTLL